MNVEVIFRASCYFGEWCMDSVLRQCENFDYLPVFSSNVWCVHSPFHATQSAWRLLNLTLASC